MSNEIILTYIIGQLNGYLAHLDRMTPLPLANSQEAIDDHDGWMAKHEQICEMVRDAEMTALTVVPPEVAEVLQAINVRKIALLNLFAMEAANK